MIEKKRFTIIQDGDNFTVRDNLKNRPMGMFEFKEDEFPVYFCFHKIIDLLNELAEENEQLKSELKWIYDVATLKKARDIVDTIYDDLLYETSEKSDYAQKKVLECLKKLDKFGDELE